jgi:hypothetical protein
MMNKRYRRVFCPFASFMSKSVEKHHRNDDLQICKTEMKQEATVRTVSSSSCVSCHQNEAKAGDIWNRRVNFDPIIELVDVLKLSLPQIKALRIKHHIGSINLCDT